MSIILIKMLLLTILVTVLTKSVFSINCDGCLNGVCYTKTRIWSESDGKISGQIAINLKNNTLYTNVKQNNDDYGQVAINIDTGKAEFLPNITTYFNGKAVDQETGDVYMYATKPGLYKHSPVTKQTQHLGLLQASGSDLQFKELLFYSGILYGLCIFFPEEGAKCFTKLRSQEVSEFVIDKYNHIYYRNSARVNRFNIATNEIEYLFTNRWADLVLDNHSNVYYIYFARVYKLDYEKDEFVEIGGFVDTQIYSAVFDRDDKLVYRDIQRGDEVFKLEANPGSCVFNGDKKKITYYEQ